MPATGLLQHPYDTAVDETVAPGVDDSVGLPVPGVPGTATATDAEPATTGATCDVGPNVTEALASAGLIRVHRGNPTAEELAAVVAVLLARAAAVPEDTADGHPVRPAPRWRRFGRGDGYRTAHSWQAGRRPRRAVRGVP